MGLLADLFPVSQRDHAGADERLLARAADLAHTVPSRPRVAALVVQAGVVLAEGTREPLRGPHAVLVALGRAGSLSRGATVYVTLEPCNHRTRESSCVDAILAAGVARVVIGARNPRARTSTATQRLRAAGVTVDHVEEPACAALALEWSVASGS